MARTTKNRAEALIDDELITLAGLLFEAEAALEHRLDERLRASSGMPLATFEVLIRLLRSPSERSGLTELGRGLAITTGGVTRLIDRLEAEKLVRRVRDTGDRRVVYAQITQRGRSAILGSIEGHVADLHEAITERLTAPEVAALERGLRALRDALCPTRDG